MSVVPMVLIWIVLSLIPIARQTIEVQVNCTMIQECPSRRVNTRPSQGPGKNLPPVRTLLPVRIDDATVDNGHVQLVGAGEAAPELGHEAGARVVALQVQLQARDDSPAGGARSLLYMAFRSFGAGFGAGCYDNVGAEVRKVHGRGEAQAGRPADDEDRLPIKGAGRRQRRRDETPDCATYRSVNY